MNSIEEFLTTNSSFDPKIIASLMPFFKVKQFEKNHTILAPDQPEMYIRFVKTGALRVHIANEKHERTTNLYTSGDFASDLLSFITQEKATKYISTITPVETFQIHRSIFQEVLYQHESTISKLYESLGLILKCMEQKQHDFLLMSPEERYQKLLSQNKEWLIDIPQYEIASFLNIKPESLSRIRKRIC